mmetsp:Transcript_77071/g.128443  ORF Transcript_77071/g.128443 Transcript_77071/m.128443 type:complete len:82 (-) Transcript_77071:196-441(-)
MQPVTLAGAQSTAAVCFCLKAELAIKNLGMVRRAHQMRWVHLSLQSPTLFSWGMATPAQMRRVGLGSSIVILAARGCVWLC